MLSKTHFAYPIAEKVEVGPILVSYVTGLDLDSGLSLPERALGFAIQERKAVHRSISIQRKVIAS